MGVSIITCSTNVNFPAPNPDPSRWRLVRYANFTNGHVLEAKYLDCTNFEGRKIMVFRGKFVCRNRLDPHFSKDKTSPIARFRPDAVGWKMACKLADSL